MSECETSNNIVYCSRLHAQMRTYAIGNLILPVEKFAIAENIVEPYEKRCT